MANPKTSAPASSKKVGKTKQPGKDPIHGPSAVEVGAAAPPAATEGAPVQDLTQKTLKAFIAEHGVSMAVKHAGSAMSEGPYPDLQDHWTVTLKCAGRRMTLDFFQGSGRHGAEPKLATVLDALASDSAGVENASGFEDWASDYGYDTDSRKAEKIYKDCQGQAEKLKALLGETAYQDLLWNCERG